jgi:MFS family permease
MANIMNIDIVHNLGRKTTMLVAMVVISVPGLSLPTFHSWLGLVAVRFFTGVGESGTFQSAFVLC